MYLRRVVDLVTRSPDGLEVKAFRYHSHLALLLRLPLLLDHLPAVADGSGSPLELVCLFPKRLGLSLQSRFRYCASDTLHPLLQIGDIRVLRL